MRNIHWRDCDRATCTMNNCMSAADTCRARGWKVGDVIEGDEGYGVHRPTITAIGREEILAACDCTEPTREGLWSLSSRCWRRVGGAS